MEVNLVPITPYDEFDLPNPGIANDKVVPNAGALLTGSGDSAGFLGRRGRPSPGSRVHMCCKPCYCPCPE
jgi:hypothetical protein